MLSDYSLFKLLHKIIDEGFDFYKIDYMSHPEYNTSTHTVNIGLIGPPSAGNVNLDYKTFLLIRIEETGWKWLQKIEEKVAGIESPSDKVKFLNKMKLDFNNYFISIESQNRRSKKELIEALIKIESDFDSRFEHIYNIYQLSEDEIKSKLHINLNQNELALFLIILYESGILKLPRQTKGINLMQSKYSIAFFGESHFTVKKESQKDSSQQLSRSLSTQMRKYSNRNLNIDVPLTALRNYLIPYLDKNKLETIFMEEDERKKRK
jgi:hypothetical protein